MENRKKVVLPVHLVTPEEPKRSRLRQSHGGDKEDPSTLLGSSSGGGGGDDNDNDNEDDSTNNEGNFFMPSVKNTRELEMELLETIHALQSDGEGIRDIDTDQIVSLLNRSITAISHWSLQAQLSQLRGNIDDRQVVETNILRKEMEFLISKRPVVDEEECEGEHSKRTAGYLRSPPYLPAKCVVKPARKICKRQPISLTPTVPLVDPISLKLVENKKPHPRMRRTSDNPSTNEYVRVFHLQRR